MKIILAGASGLIGSELAAQLRAAGHAVFRLVRREAREADEIGWDPAAATIAGAGITGADAIVNLAGENVGAGRWTAQRREVILRSRIEATRTLVAAMTASPARPAVLINASAVGYYGDGGDEVLTEASGVGRGFLPEVCAAWEREAQAAEALGVRVARLRFGVVLAANGGALAKMLPAFRIGLGGRLGHGRQWMSWISLEDAVRAVLHAIGDARCVGAINVVAPEPLTNAAFTAALGRVLRRPTVLPAPAWALRAALGAMADEALLASSRAQPVALQRAGFSFRHADVETALRAVLR